MLGAESGERRVQVFLDSEGDGERSGSDLQGGASAGKNSAGAIEWNKRVERQLSRLTLAHVI